MFRGPQLEQSFGPRIQFERMYGLEDLKSTVAFFAGIDIVLYAMGDPNLYYGQAQQKRGWETHAAKGSTTLLPLTAIRPMHFPTVASRYGI